MELTHVRERKVDTLSKGMQQKLQFISVLLHDPELIILDEPFSGLDPVNTELIKDIILEEKRSGRTIIFSTHVMEQAEKLCDHITLISRGEKVLDGPLFEIKSKFGRNSVIAEIDGDATEFESLDDVERVSDFNKYVEFKIAQGGNPQNLLKALAEKTTVNRFEVVEPSLHDIFVDVVRSGERRSADA
jgi:ABC-2 type transport system ATP-binding protein